MEDYLVLYDNETNPLEELADCEEYVIGVYEHEKHSRHDIILDIYTCPNLKTTFPVMKIYTTLSTKKFESLEDHEYMQYHHESNDTVKVVSYLSLSDARYVTCVDINNRILFKNYKFNKEEMVHIIKALNIPGGTVFNTTYSEMLDKINTVFVDKNSKYFENPEKYSTISHLSLERLKNPIYKYHFYGRNIPNYGSLIKKGDV